MEHRNAYIPASLVLNTINTHHDYTPAYCILLKLEPVMNTIILVEINWIRNKFLHKPLFVEPAYCILLELEPGMNTII